MHLSTALLGVLAIPALAQKTVLNDVTIFTPPADYTVPRTLYARTLLIKEACGQDDNVLLATWENYLPNNDSHPYFPIYQSLDLGETWSERSKVYDQVNGWGLRYQPFLYELPKAIGKFKAGTILLAGNSIPDDLSETQIDLYASTDKGYTWKFLSHIAHGGEALPNNGLTPVWEPFLLLHNGELIVYYSDQRDPAHGQKLVHQTSKDLLHWTAPVNDVAYSNYTSRPGMTTVSQLPKGQWLITYEYGGAPEGDFANYYRIASDPLKFNDSPGHVIKSPDGTVPISSPYNIYTPAGGSQGTVLVSCGTLAPLFVNTLTSSGELSATWEKVAVAEGISYTRNLRVMPNDSRILVTGGGRLGGKNNSVTTSEYVLKAAGKKFKS